MESDIVERLLDYAVINEMDYPRLPSESKILRDAAAEIERLRAELAAANAQLVAKTDELVAMSKMCAAVTMIMEEMQRDEAAAWQPIETAPMDGTVVMLYGDGRVTCGSWISERDLMVGEYLGSHLSGETLPAYWQSHDGGFTEEHPPTLWMQMPQPSRRRKGVARE